MKLRWSVPAGAAVLVGAGVLLFNLLTGGQVQHVLSGDSQSDAVSPERPVKHLPLVVGEKKRMVPGIADHPHSDGEDSGTTADTAGFFAENRTPFNVGATSIHPDDAHQDEADPEVVDDVGDRLENPLQEVRMHSGEPVQDVGPHMDPMTTLE